MGAFTTATILLSLTAAFICPAVGEHPYYGKLIANNWGAGASNGLSGQVYAVNKDSFQVIGFTFDGAADDSYFVVGTDKSYDSAQAASGEDSTAIRLSNPSGRLEALPAYDNKDVILELPNETPFSDITYIAMYSEGENMFLGGVEVPSSFQAPAPQNIGKFTTRAHNVASGEVTILDDRTISIKSLRYDGQGPDAFFYVGITDEVDIQNAPYGKIPDENGRIDEVARAYSDRDIVLTLPAGISATDLRWLSIYCITYRHNFGEVMFPANLNVPPHMEIEIDRSDLNCEPLSDKLQVSWMVEDNDIVFELAGNIDRSVDYMAFGLSGSESTYSMIGADVVVADWMDGQQPRAIDYHLTSYAQCADNGGVCPDDSVSNGGNDDVAMPTGQITNGIVRIKYKRPLRTGDSTNDKVYRTDGTAQQIAWAIGPLNSKMEAAKHYASGGRISTAKAIDFGRDAVDNCPAFTVSATQDLPDFTAHHIYGDEVDAFTFEIGQSASEQGYKAITGSPSWGIAWYVNSILVPELHLKRGVEYTFRVAGGTNAAEGAMYHPLYITTDPLGGKSQKPDSTETVFPGRVNGQSTEKATGPYCEWKLTSEAIQKADSGNIYQCFEEFQKDLRRECTDEPPQYTDFKWTADDNTPDTVYYQCYTHANLGWKIHVYDEFPAVRQVSPESCPVGTSSSSHIKSALPTALLSCVVLPLAYLL